MNVKISNIRRGAHGGESTICTTEGHLLKSVNLVGLHDKVLYIIEDQGLHLEHKKYVSVL